ncbi:maleylacetate reductase [Peribacillus glennii]|uniref:Maleylacetate reductase n=1 Tax=Peribacillus glennii TaxID=2303991 RepID=A0A372LGJ2_9BACI|nr:maleylacetate reductase [Peribacillus glennii]RFU65104.1 maleylacetate reductase [Peribacillus glennii]
MKPFNYDSYNCRVVFGADSINNIKAEVEALKSKKALVISTPGRLDIAKKIDDLLGDSSVGIFPDAVQHVPIETVENCLEIVDKVKADSLIAIGGGSAIGLAKAISLQSAIPIIAIPTTYSGSEMTPIWGITEKGQKKTGNDPIVKPQVVIYDPVLTTGLPKHISVTSGMNAIAHCVEGLYTRNSNPVITLIAEEGIRTLFAILPRILENPSDLEIRSEALYGSWLGGTVLGSVGMALHHKLCHILGGSFGLPHAETHSVVLPYVIWYNFSHIPEATEIMARAIGSKEEDVAGSLFDLALALGIPMSLADLGLKEHDLDQAAELAIINTYYNPRPIDKSLIRQLLQYAYQGKRPEPGNFFVDTEKQIQ